MSSLATKRDEVPGLADKLGQARVAAGLSVADASSGSDVHRVSISEYEAGRKTPGLAVLIRLARAYGVTINDLVPADLVASLPPDEPVARPMGKFK